jgi:hypothetical protein
MLRQQQEYQRFELEEHALACRGELDRSMNFVRLKEVMVYCTYI